MSMLPGSDPTQTPAGWHLDRRVPIALILTLAIQTVGIVWWASDLTARVAKLEQAAPSPERLVRVETYVEGLRESIGRVERKLDRLLETSQ